MKCDICSCGTPKYKCPACLVPYCSLDCWKQHKLGVCKTVPHSTTAIQNGTEYKHVTGDTVPIEKLKLLGRSEHLLNILKEPQLREILIAVDESSAPETIFDRAMHMSLFKEFVDECLNIIEPAPMQTSDLNIDELGSV